MFTTKLIFRIYFCSLFHLFTEPYPSDWFLPTILHWLLLCAHPKNGQPTILRISIATIDPNHYYILQQPWSPSYQDNTVSSWYWLNMQAALLVAQSTKLPYLFIDDAWVTGFLVNSFITSNNRNWNHKCGVFKLLQFVVQKHKIIDQIDDVFRRERPI